MNIFRYLLILIIFLFSCATLLGADETTYIVQQGDTLYGISKKYNVSVAVLMEYNKITNVQSVRAGSKIIIPSLSVYIVKKGDTCYSISRSYKITADALMAANNIKDAGSLKIGQKLFIPGGTANPATAASTGTVSSTDTKTNSDNSLHWPHTGPQKSYNGKMQGILIEGQQGDLVYSSSSGRVIWSNPFRGYGNVALVQADDGYIYGYLGNDELVVSVGEQVETGSAIGRMGTYFHSSQSSLLFIVYHEKKRVYMDPKVILSSKK